MADTAREANHRALDRYPGLVEALLAILKGDKTSSPGEWTGTPTELASLLSGCIVGNLPPVNQLSGELQRLAPALEAMGISVRKLKRKSKARRLHMKQHEVAAESAV